jgi:hypothetical protein
MIHHCREDQVGALSLTLVFSRGRLKSCVSQVAIVHAGYGELAVRTRGCRSAYLQAAQRVYSVIPFPSSLRQNDFQGSNCRMAGPVSHERDETIRRHLHPGSNLEHLTPVWMWSQAEPEEINDGAEGVRELGSAKAG